VAAMEKIGGGVAVRVVAPLAIAVVLLLTLCGCDTCDEGLGDYEYVLCEAESLELPDSVALGDTIWAEIHGITYPGCHDSATIECKLVGSTWVLRPIARHFLDEGCRYMIWRHDAIVALTPPRWGRFYVAVLSLGPPLLDSTYVVFVPKERELCSE
jgi:hypothetical protein